MGAGRWGGCDTAPHGSGSGGWGGGRRQGGGRAHGEGAEQAERLNDPIVWHAAQLGGRRVL